MPNTKSQKGKAAPVFINQRTLSEILSGSDLENPQIKFNTDGTYGIDYNNLGNGYQPAPVVSRNQGKDIGSVPHIQHLLTEEGKAEELLNLQNLNSLVSKDAAKSFDKSAYAAYPWKVLGYAAKGAADFGVSVVDAVRTAGDDMNAIINNQAFHNMVDNLDANNKDKKHAQAVVGYLQAAGYSRAEVANFNIDNPFDKNGNQMKPLSEEAKEIFKLYQEHLKSQEKLEYNRLANSFYQEDISKNYWAIKGFNKGDETLQKFGEFVGQGLASSAVFGLTGSAASLGLAEAATAGRLLKKGIDLGSAAAKTGGITTAGRVAAMLGTKKINLANFALENFGKLQAVASIAGATGVFSLSGDMAYREARDLALAKGYSFDDANAIAVVAGIAGGGIETFFNMKYTSKFITEKSPTFWNIAMMEAVPEGLQEMSSEAVSKVIYNFTGLEDSTFKDIAGDLIVSFCGGMMGGFAFGLAGRADINAEARVAGLANYEAEQRKKGTFVPPAGPTVPPTPPAAPVTKEQQEGQEAVEKIEMSPESTMTEEEQKIWAEQQKTNIKQDAGTDAEYDYAEKAIGQGQAVDEKTLTEEQRREDSGFYRKRVNIKNVQFSEAQQHILTEMKSEYIQRAKRNNPNITEKQLENGWRIIENMMKHEVNTGEFTQTLNNNIDALISSIDASDERVKKNLEKLSKKYGSLQQLNISTDFYYTKLLSKNEKEKYDAEWEIAKKFIEDEFALNGGSRAQGKAIAEIIKNRAYVIGLYFEGTPLELYQQIKPTIINLSRARMNSEFMNERSKVREQKLNVVHSLLDDLKDKELIQGISTLKETKEAKTKATDVYNKMSNLPFIENAEDKKAAIEEISVELFGYSDTLKTEEEVEDLLNAIKHRAEKEFAVMEEMGLIDGNSVLLTPDDFYVIGLLREQGYKFENIVKAMGMKVKGIRSRDLAAEYKEAVQKLFPPLTRQEIKLLNNLNPDARKERRFRSDPEREKVEQKQIDDIFERAAKKKSKKEKEEQEEKEVDLQELINAPLKVEEKIGHSATQKKHLESEEAFERRERTRTGEPLLSYVEPSGLYARIQTVEGLPKDLFPTKTIIIKDTSENGELLHEGGHYVIVEMLLNATELARDLGIELTGSLKEVFDIIDESIKLAGKKLTIVNKQETLLDALVLLAREGTTGNPNLDQALTAVRAELGNKFMSPQGSVLAEMSDEELGGLGKALKAFLSPSEPIAIIESLTDLENNLGELETEGMAEKLFDLMTKFNYPFADEYYSQLMLLMLDGPENVSKYHLILLADSFITEAKTFAVERLISNELSYKKIVKDGDNIIYEDKDRRNIRGEETDTYFFQKSPTVTEGNQHFEKVGDEIRPDTERPFGATTSVKQDVASLPDKFKKLYADTKQAITPMFYSMTDIFAGVSKKLSAALQNAQWEREKLHRSKIQPVIDLKNLIDDHNRKFKSNDEKFISLQDQYDFMDALRNKDTSKALNVFAGKMDAVTREKAESLFNEAIEGLKEMRIRLEKVGVAPAAGWIEDGQYWPFVCLKFEELCHYLDTHPDNQLARIARREEELAKQQGIKDRKQIQARILDAVNGIAYGKNPEARVTAFHSRSTKLVDKELFQFYMDPFEAYMSYMADATTTVMNRTLFGKVDKNTNFTGGLFAKILKEEGLLEKSLKLSEQTPEEIAILPKEERAVALLVESVRDYMQRTSTPEAWRKLNDVINMFTIGQFSSAIGQGMELALTAVLYGAANTAKGLALAKSGKGLTLEDLHISDINETFRETSRGILNAITNFTLTASMFKASDKFLKLVTINAIHNWIGTTLQKGEAAGHDYKKLMKRLDEAFDGLTDGNVRKGGVVEAILNNEMTDDVKYFVSTLLMKQQPLNSISIQSKYNSMSPLGKLCVYKLNTVTGKQMVALIEEFKERWNEEDWGDLLKFLLKHIVYSMVVGLPVTTAQSLVNLKEPKFVASTLLSPVQVFGLNLYTYNMTMNEGIGATLSDRFTPPLAFVSDFFTPAVNIARGKNLEEIGFDRWAKVFTTATGYSGFFAGLIRATNDIEGSLDIFSNRDLPDLEEAMSDAIDQLVFK